ncbi:N-acetylneuraminate synthase family protein [Deltaproteobacteria bacterium OttesenSCG-928-M10]|nr:N-acetylneuraminate synthase family protein [Deltaproteobacteria bacterium OttesenSCG-928-M10]
MNRAFEINVVGRPVGPGRPALLVAEIGGNHGGDAGLAGRMVEAAAGAGADAVKFQAYRTHDFLSRLNPYYDELAAEELPFADLAFLVGLAHEKGLGAGLTVFDEAGLRLAEECGADFLKISSGDLTNHPLLAKVATVRKPLFISTGAADEGEVRAALAACGPAENRLVVMQCTALYPAPPEAANLAVPARWLDEGLAAGYSDHVAGLEAADAALSLGAVVLEKHFTVDQSLPGGDNSISALPADLAKLRGRISGAAPGRGATARPPAGISPVLWGSGDKRPHPLEMPMRPIIRRAVLAAVNLQAGRVLGREDLALRRPPAAGDFLGPQEYEMLPGRTLKHDMPEGAPLSWADLA